MSAYNHPPEQERRRFSRIPVDMPAELHQGGAVWNVRLRSIGLNGFVVTQPAQWDADYSHPFSLNIRLNHDTPFEAFGHLVHIDHSDLGFQLEHLGAEQIAPLARLLAGHLDEQTLAEELQRLDEANRD
jgi:hypothetical protein